MRATPLADIFDVSRNEDGTYNITVDPPEHPTGLSIYRVPSGELYALGIKLSQTVLGHRWQDSREAVRNASKMVDSHHGDTEPASDH